MRLLRSHRFTDQGGVNRGSPTVRTTVLTDLHCLSNMAKLSLLNRPENKAEMGPMKWGLLRFETKAKCEDPLTMFINKAQHESLTKELVCK